MLEVLPLRLLTDQDSPIFGSLVNLGKLYRANFPVAHGIAVSPPHFKLKTILEHFDFGKKEVFEQSLTLVEKEINSLPVPQILDKEAQNEHFFLAEEKINSSRVLWLKLLQIWLAEIKQRIWNNGFDAGVTDNLTPQAVIFIKSVDSRGIAFFDVFADDVVINTESKLHPGDQNKIYDLVIKANQKLFLPFEYSWIFDGGIKLTGLKPYTPPVSTTSGTFLVPKTIQEKAKSTIKVFFDLSAHLLIEKNVDGVYISSEKIFDLVKPQASFDNLLFKLVESALTYQDKMVLFKLADLPESNDGMSKVRGTLRLLHQKSLLDPLMEVIDFARHKKGLTNVHIVIPFVRSSNELMQIKRELSTKKLMRKNSLQIWLEIAVPENIINLENYLEAGIDGAVLNLDQLIAYLNGFDPLEESLSFYKNEVAGLIKFLDQAVKTLHKAKIPFIAFGSLSLNHEILQFLVGKGLWGIVVEKYELAGIYELLHRLEKRIILSKV